MVRSVRFLLGCALLLLSSSAVAQTQAAAREPVGLSLGLRLGYGIPGGKVGALQQNSAEDAVLSDGVEGTIPITLDLGYRITPNFTVGASIQYAFGLVNEDEALDCPNCSIDVIAIGLNLYYHVLPGATFDPWVGAGLGYEILTISNSDTAGGQALEASLKLEGLQYLVLQLGGDFGLKGAPIFIGPYVSISVGRYENASITVSTQGRSMSQDQDLARTAWHQWVTLGLQGHFDF